MAYFPNGTAGLMLDEQCSGCILGEVACPIWYVQQHFNYADENVTKGSKLQECLNLLISEDYECALLKLLPEAAPALVHHVDEPCDNDPTTSDWNDVTCPTCWRLRWAGL